MTDNNSPIPDEVIHKELDLLQGCISRMSHISLVIKGWTLTLLTLFLTAMQTKGFNAHWYGIALFGLVVLAFLILDVYYMWTEDRFCKQYERVLKLRPKGDRTDLYVLNPNNWNKIVPSPWYKPFTAISIWLFYGILFVVLMAMCFMLPANNGVVQ